MKLISVTDFVLQEGIRHTAEQQYFLICGYAEFLKQPLTLGMFVPVMSNGVILNNEEIKSFEGTALLEEYREAKERVLFKGIELTEDKYKETKRKFWYIDKLKIAHELKFYSGEIQFTFDVYRDHKTIEDIVKYNLELTDSAIKQLGL